MKLVCVDSKGSSGLTIGKVYTLVGGSGERTRNTAYKVINDLGVSSTYFVNRFITLREKNLDTLLYER